MIGFEGQGRSVWSSSVYLFAVIVLIVLIAPILIVAAISFSSNETLSFPPESFSVRWYVEIWNSPAWQRSIRISFMLASLSTVMTTLVAMLAAFSLVRGQFPGKNYVYALIFSPMIVPTIITAVAIYFLVARLGWTGSIPVMAMGHTILALPTAVMIISASLQSVDRRYELAAFSLGASRLTTLRRITMPLISPALITSALFSFLLSFEELLIPLFLASPGSETLAVRIWNSLLLEVDPAIAAVSTLFVMTTVVVLLITFMLRKRQTN